VAGSLGPSAKCNLKVFSLNRQKAKKGHGEIMSIMKENIVKRRIMWGDLDALGIVFYPRYYEWFDSCAHQFFEAIGIPHDCLWKEHGIVFGLAETQCRYLNAGRYHQRVKILTRLEHLNKKSLTLQHVISHEEDGKILVVGMEKRICMDASNPQSLRITTIPEMVYTALEQALADST
jgi:YbgC/YbaW family acyl-CoA thioester hydrolase